MFRYLILLSLIVTSGCFEKQNGSLSATVQDNQVEEYYTCSMHPHIREDKPGKCPICQMNLTKVSVTENDPEVSAAGGTSQNVLYRCKDFPDVTSEKPDICPLDGTRMVKVERSTAGQVVARVRLNQSQVDHFKAAIFSVTPMKMVKKLRVLGQVRSAEEKMSAIAARFPARVEKVYVESVGSYIRAGDPVLKVYSPQLLTAIEELLLSNEKSNQAPAEFKQLYEKAKEKLVLWGILPRQIQTWKRSGQVPREVTIYASSSGVVRNRNALPGKYFSEGQNYFELSDLSQVWVEMDVYEHDSNLVKLGQKVELDFVAIAGKSKTGEIDFISPTIDPKNRTLKVRATIANKQGELKPGMVAQGIVSVDLEGLPLVVPSPAVIDTGVRKVVWLRSGKGHSYIAKQVESGFQSDGYTEIVNGLQEGDQVVIDGNFLLDAQAQFFGGYEKFNQSEPHAAHGH